MAPPRAPSRAFTSPLLLLYAVAGLILVGTLLLSLPLAHRGEGFTSFVIALFTAASAVTVTGLVIVDTGVYWSPFGQGVILALIAVGGLGFMTLATFLLIVLGQRITLAERLMMRDTLGTGQLGGLVRLIRNVVLLVLVIYLLGFLALIPSFRQFYTFPEALWQAAFHSISGFNNAGFTIVGGNTSLRLFQLDLYPIAIMIILMVLGSISYTVLVDLFRVRRFSRLTLDTRLVLVATLFLYALGTLVIFGSEYANPNTLGGMDVGHGLFNSLFHAVSGRTAGFSTLDFGQTRENTNLFTGVLMFIGGASGSTAGGIKVNTFAVIVVAILASIRGRTQVEAFGREVPSFLVQRALAIAALALALLFVVAFFLTFTEDAPFSQLFFETFSAFGTAGLSTGITSQLSNAGQYLLVFTMFVGRVGPLTLALALIPREERALYRYAQERVKIG
ncbi:MAG: TrkH family potassium uptake protein [Dehalococcoidia bacterium]